MFSLPKPYYTPEQYLERERLADYKSEYFAGEIFAMAGASRTHNLISGNVSASLTTQLRDRPCEVYANDMRVQADGARQYSYPDVVVVCGEAQFRDGHEDTLTNRLVIVEVLSPATEASDRGENFNAVSPDRLAHVICLVIAERAARRAFREAARRLMADD